MSEVPAHRTIGLARPPEQFSASILIVDDHSAVRTGLRNLISSRAGWQVCGEAVNGEQAVEMAQQLEPSAIVMDISMPVMDGLEATRRIRELLPKIEVLIVSQHDSETVVVEAQRAGARGFVMKSHLSADLLPALEAALLHSSRVSAPVSKTWQNALSAKPTVKGTYPDPGPHDDLDLMSGGGEMGALMRAHDWAKTPFGPVSKWPQSLRTALRICLDSRFPILIWWGPDLRILFNDAYRPSLGTTKYPQAIGAPGREIWSDIWDTIGPSLENVINTGQASWENDQVLLFDRHGYLEESYWTYSYSAIRLTTGEIGGVFSAVHEVTDKILMSRRLKTLRELADQMSQAKTDVDACTLAMQTIVRNPADCPYTMIFLREAHGFRRVAASFDASKEVPTVIDISQGDAWGVQKTLQTRTPQVFEVKNPDTMPAAPYGDRCKQAMSLPILGTNREPIGVLTIGISPNRALDSSYREFFETLARNVSENINTTRAYYEERKRAEALAELDRAKTLFFSNVSHEFRTPLTLMLGPLENALAAKDTFPAEHREQLEVAHRNSVRLLRLVNTLLDFSRIEAGRIQASYEPTDLSAFTAELASVFRSAMESAGLRLLVHCDPIPEPAYIDREMWEKIVFNLLSNALKFTFDGEVEISLRAVDRVAELTVRDTGTGIPEQEVPRLFERFYRVKGARGRTFEGSGIGLSLVQELTRLHGGSVRVQSEFNKGSVFTVSIPLGKDHLAPEKIGAGHTMVSTAMRGDAYVQEALRWLPGQHADDDLPSSTSLSTTEAPLETENTKASATRILLADDNPDMRDYVHRLLRGSYQVEAVQDGQAALESARRQLPDLIVSDIMMPRLDGIGLLQAVRTDPVLKSIPVILLSARAGEEARIEGLESGADDYLVKPFSARELVARVRSQLAMSRIRHEASAIAQRLRADSELLAAIVESSDDAIISKDLDGVITSWNKSAERIFGYTAAEAIGNTIMLIIPAERRDEEAGILARLRRGERVDHVRTVRRRKDGSLLDVSLTISPVRDASGKVIGASKVARDVTAQALAETAMRESEERFRAIVQTTPECVKLITAEGKLLHMNSAGLRMLGASALDQVAGQSVYEMIAPEDRDRFRAFNQRVCRGESGTLQFDMIGLHGGRCQMESHAAPFRNADGGTVQLAVTRDVSERKRAEAREQTAAAEAIAANAKFRAIFEQTTVFAGIMTKDGVLVEANKMSLDACGFKAEEVLGKSFHATAWWRNSKESQAKIREATPLAAQGIPYRETLVYSWADGTERLVDFALYPIVDDHGNVFCLHPTGVDVTAQKLAEEKYRALAESLDAEVRARTAQLQSSNSDVLNKSRQLSELSWHLMKSQENERRHIARELHDSAGQTLTVLGIGLAQLVQKASRNAPELASEAELIQQTVQQLHREIRTTSYLLHPPLLDESGLGPAIGWYIEGVGERSGLKIELDVPRNMIRLPREMEMMIFRIVQESLANIHRHSGSKTAKIRIEQAPQSISVEIQDHGRGMSPERLAEIQTQGAGVGIRGMRERLLQFAGSSMQIDSGSSGTRILVTIPIPEQAGVHEKNDGLSVAV